MVSGWMDLSKYKHNPSILSLIGKTHSATPTEKSPVNTPEKFLAKGKKNPGRYIQNRDLAWEATRI